MLASLLLLSLGLVQEPPSPGEEFRRYAEKTYAGDNVYLGRKPRQDIEAQLEAKDLDAAKRVELETSLGKELIQANDLARAVELLEGTLARAIELGIDSRPTRRVLALAFLRDAENQNCIDRHNSECCIFPLKGGALHTQRSPAEEARKHYIALLEADPNDLDALWLLNILAMALGEYPDGVDERFRIPPSAFASEGPMRAFRDVGEKLGVDRLSLAGGASVDDYDGDGWLDIMISTSDPEGHVVLYHNGGDGTFEDRSEAAGLLDQFGGLNMISGDYDNDGDQDAMVLRGGWQAADGCIRRSLLANDGHAVFRDVTYAAGLAVPPYPSQSALWADLDSDGWLDFYSGNESRGPEGAQDYPSQLFHAKGDGTFVDVARETGTANDRFAKGVGVGDYDNDGDLDLYVSNIGPNRLYRNDGQLRFVDVAPELGVVEPSGRSFSTWFFDYDNDGWLDLMVWGYSARNADLAAAALGRPHQAILPCLYRNRGGTFRNVAQRMGLARPFLPMGANFGDVDNDGWLDIYLGTGEPPLQSLMPNVMLHNAAGQRFLDVTTVSGTGHLQKGHGVAFADLDHDGDQDLFHELGGFFPVDRFRSALFENPGPVGHWLSMELIGTQTNRDAAGARVKVVLATPNGLRELHRAPGCVSSFGGSPHRQEIGLGDATSIQRVEIRWPRSKELQVLEGVPMDVRIRVKEGKAGFERLETHAVHF